MIAVLSPLALGILLKISLQTISHAAYYVCLVIHQPWNQTVKVKTEVADFFRSIHFSQDPWFPRISCCTLMKWNANAKVWMAEKVLCFSLSNQIFPPEVQLVALIWGLYMWNEWMNVSTDALKDTMPFLFQLGKSERVRVTKLSVICHHSVLVESLIAFETLPPPPKVLACCLIMEPHSWEGWVKHVTFFADDRLLY